VNQPTEKQLRLAAAEHDVDIAVKSIQDVAGITTGDVAGQFFDPVSWTQLGYAARFWLLTEWLKAEATYEYYSTNILEGTAA
jgi:hypothetical protein